VAYGTVKQWSDDEGWGVVISPEVPGEVWAHFSHIVDDDETAYRSLNDGGRVRFDYEHYSPAHLWFETPFAPFGGRPVHTDKAPDPPDVLVMARADFADIPFTDQLLEHEA
jgi:cold shock protein